MASMRRQACVGTGRILIHFTRFIGVALMAIVLTSCSGSKIPQITSEASSGPLLPTPTPAPAPGSATPKSVVIYWSASHATDVGLAGGGYKVWVHLGTAPTTANTTPVSVPNPGTGIHVTTKTVTLDPGRYYVSISSYSSNGDSTLSAPVLLVVP
jgi:hypothetical protein